MCTHFVAPVAGAAAAAAAAARRFRRAACATKHGCTRSGICGIFYGKAAGVQAINHARRSPATMHRYVHGPYPTNQQWPWAQRYRRDDDDGGAVVGAYGYWTCELRATAPYRYMRALAMHDPRGRPAAACTHPGDN